MRRASNSSLTPGLLAVLVKALLPNLLLVAAAGLASYVVFTAVPILSPAQKNTLVLLWIVGGAIYGLIDGVRAALRHSRHRARSSEEAHRIDLILQYIGEDHVEIAPGVYRSSDGTRQLRVTMSDLPDRGRRCHSAGPLSHFRGQIGT